MTLDTESIRQTTRVALPADDSYLFRLGVALYGCACVNSFIAEIVTYLDASADRTQLGDLTSGDVLDSFRHAARLYSDQSARPPARRAGDEFERLNTERTDFVHSSPITNSFGEQILRRRKDDKNKYSEVTNDFLDGFIGRLEEVCDALYENRAVLRPNL